MCDEIRTSLLALVPKRSRLFPAKRTKSGKLPFILSHFSTTRTRRYNFETRKIRFCGLSLGQFSLFNKIFLSQHIEKNLALHRLNFSTVIELIESLRADVDFLFFSGPFPTKDTKSGRRKIIIKFQ